MSRLEVVNSTNSETKTHVLMRVVSAQGHTVSAHKEMVARKGVALFGKMGRPISKNFQDTLNGQIANGEETFFFLITREGVKHEYITHKCRLTHVYAGMLDAAKQSLVPDYYAHDIPNIQTWFEITTFVRLTPDEAAAIYTLSTGEGIMKALKGTGSVFRVGVRPGGK
jgi:hypothetical protein